MLTGCLQGACQKGHITGGPLVKGFPNHVLQGPRVTEEPEEMGPLLISPKAHQNKSVYNLYVLGLFKASQGDLRGGQIIPLWNHLLDGGGRKCF